MWRLWTRGWYLSGWWEWVKQSMPMWIAFRLPKNVAYWAFVRVYANSGIAPGPEYKQVFEAWRTKETHGHN